MKSFFRELAFKLIPKKNGEVMQKSREQHRKKPYVWKELDMFKVFIPVWLW